MKIDNPKKLQILYLVNKERRTYGDLKKLIDVSEPTLARLLKTMLEEELILETIDRNDRRKKIYASALDGFKYMRRLVDGFQYFTLLLQDYSKIERSNKEELKRFYDSLTRDLMASSHNEFLFDQVLIGFKLLLSLGNDVIEFPTTDRLKRLNGVETDRKIREFENSILNLDKITPKSLDYAVGSINWALESVPDYKTILDAIRKDNEVRTKS